MSWGIGKLKNMPLHFLLFNVVLLLADTTLDQLKREEITAINLKNKNEKTKETRNLLNYHKRKKKVVCV